MGIFCADLLATHGVSIYANGLSGNLILQGENYKVGKIKSRLGVPQESMNPEERLGLFKPKVAQLNDQVTNSSHSVREIKRAYRMRAREWHPDKWAQALSGSNKDDSGHNVCEHHVRNSFRLIIDAFNTLVPESRNTFENVQP